MPAESNSLTLTPAKDTGAFLVLPAESYKNLNGIRLIILQIADECDVDVLTAKHSILNGDGFPGLENGFIVIPIEKLKATSSMHSQVRGFRGNS